MVEEFISTNDPSKNVILADRLMINQCFYHFKHLYRDMQKKKGGGGGAAAVGYSGPNFGNVEMKSPAKETDEKELKEMQGEQ
jgi:hypothetical protein